VNLPLQEFGKDIALPLLFFAAMLLATPMSAATQAASVPDCNPSKKLDRGFSRIFIALRNGRDGSGRSPEDALDGNTVEKFDRILRCYAEGCKDANTPRKSISRLGNLVVCLGPGTFQTKGAYDALIDVPHKSENGFTIGKGWRIHGSGRDKTAVQLAAYLPARDGGNPQHLPEASATGVVFSTNSDDASDVEISDLTIDDNYPALKAQAAKNGINALTLEAIHLRSDRGHNWIHDVNVIHAAGQIGAINIKYEAFPIFVYSVKAGSKPQDNSGNVIERVSMSAYGGGPCTAIAVANAVGEVRNNRVDGYAIGYGGWVMGQVRFHDNMAVNTEYGFNIDSLANDGVVIEKNQIIHPTKYGIVIGGPGTYSNFLIQNNTIQIDRPGVIGLLFRGNVTNATVSGNRILAEGFALLATAIRNYSGEPGDGPNRNNSYQGNTISSRLRIVFKKPSRKEDNCFAGNHDENGHPLRDLADYQAGSCSTATPASSAPRQH